MNRENVFRLVVVAVLVFLIYQFGFKPIFVGDDNAIRVDRQYWSGLLSTEDDPVYDVIVYGAEPQGVSAAISSARLGARTLLISENQDMGGIILRCLIPELEVPYDSNAKMLNNGILKELYDKTGKSFTADKYLIAVNELIQAESDLSTMVSSTLTGVKMSGNHIDSVNVQTNNGKKELSARIFIDASDSGVLLEMCGVPYFTGSGDLNFENNFMPVSLNFEMTLSSADTADAGDLEGFTAVFSNGEGKYKPLNGSVRLEDPHICFMPGNKAIVSGLQISGVNVLDSSSMRYAYEMALEEAKNLSRYLSENFVELKGYTYSSAAQSLRVRDSKHYKGKYMLTVDDILQGMYFDDAAAMGSAPVIISKFAVKGSYLAGKADRYSIPLRSLIPYGISNMLMVGPRVSYSSLASSSAGTIGVSIATGEAAGGAAVLCAARNESPAFLNTEHEYFKEFEAILSEKDMYLPDKTTSYKFKNNWSYGSARRLLSLGLIAGGRENDLRYQTHAAQKDLAYILINGIYRMDSDKYTEELNGRLERFINESSLTFDDMVRMLGALYDIDGETEYIYKRLCELNRVNGVMQQRLAGMKSNTEVLTMDMVYYIGAYSIQSYTGRDISDVLSNPLFSSGSGKKNP